MSDLIDGCVRLFNQVRDLPYRINPNDPDDDNSCLGKSRRLASALWTEFRIESRYACSHFLWSSLPLRSEFHKLNGKNGTKHVCLEVLVPWAREYTRVDPIWDSRLRDAGFKITEWDGKNPTARGIQPKEDYDPEQSARIVDVLIKAQERRTNKAPGENPYARLNQWLESVRSTPGAPFA